MVIGKLVCEVFFVLTPIYQEFSMCRTISNPIKRHANFFRSVFLDGFVGNTCYCRIVEKNMGERLWMPNFGESVSNGCGITHIKK